MASKSSWMTETVSRGRPDEVRKILGRAALMVLVASGLAACGSSKKTAKVSGERIAILSSNEQLEPDPRLTNVAVALPPPEVNADWTQAGGRADHVMMHLDLGDQPKEVGRVDVGAGSDDDRHIVAPPVIGGGRVYTIDASGEVRAFSADEGKRLWDTDITPEDVDGAIIAGGIAYADGRIYVASGYAQVLALDAATGKVLWRENQPAPMHAPPTVASGRVFVTTIGNQLIALAAEDGRRLWIQSGPEQTAGLLGGASPAADGGIVIAPFTTGDILAVRVETGRVAWGQNLAAARRVNNIAALADIRGRPVIDRGMVFAISHSGRLSGIDLRTGDRLWDLDIAGQSQPWLAGDYLYVVSETGQVFCVTRQEGLVRWVSQLPQREDPQDKRSKKVTWYGPVLAGDRLILAGSNGEAITLSPYNGDILGREDIDAGPLLMSPVIADRTLYFLSDDGKLVAYR